MNMNKSKKKRSLLNLFLTSTKLSFVSFGGGNAIIPFYEKEFVEKDKSLSESELLNIITIANSIPGPSVIEMSTGIGYYIHGFWGALVCMLGVLIPVPFTFVLIYSQLDFLKDSEIFIKIAKSIIPVISGLLLKLAFDYFMKSRKELKLLYLLSLVILVTGVIIIFNINPSIPVIVMIFLVILFSIKIGSKK